MIADARARPAVRSFIELVRSLRGDGRADHGVEVLVQEAGPLVDELACLAPTVVAASRPPRGPSGLVERLAGRVGGPSMAGRLRGARLGLARLGPDDAVHLQSVRCVQVLRYLPAHVPVLCTVSERSLPLGQVLSEPDRDLLLARVGQFLATTTSGVRELVEVHDVDPARVTRVAEVVVAAPASKRAPGAGLVVGVFSGATGALPPLVASLAASLRQRSGDDLRWLVTVPAQRADGWVDHDLEAAGVADRVDVVDLEPDGEVAADACDVVVHTAWGEDHPVAYLEAAAAGVPVVCFEGHELAEVVGRDEGGTVCPRLDLRAVSDAVAALATDSSLRRQRGRQAAVRALDRHTAGAAAEEIRTLVAKARAG